MIEIAKTIITRKIINDTAAVSAITAPFRVCKLDIGQTECPPPLPLANHQI